MQFNGISNYNKSLNKNGNIVLSIFPMFVILVIASLFIVIVIYSQIIIGIINIKSDIFYIVQNSIIKLNKDELSYGKYVIDEKALKEQISSLILKNYILDDKGNVINRSAGIMDVKLNEVKYYTEASKIMEHTGKLYDKEIIHVDLTVKTKTVLNIGVKDVYETKIHEDIKMTRMKMF